MKKAIHSERKIWKQTCRRAENMSWRGAKVNAIRMLNVENLGTKRIGVLISIYKYKLYSQSI